MNADPLRPTSRRLDLGNYTDEMEDRAYAFGSDGPGDPESRDMLISMIQKYHTDADVIDELLIYSGTVSQEQLSSMPEKNADMNMNLKEKASLIRKLFHNAEIPVPRNLNDFLTGAKRFDRRTAYQFAFAFHLNESETETLFRKAWLGRVFDCHDTTEAVFWYCIRKGYSYQRAQSVVSRIPALSKGNMPCRKPEEYVPDFSETESLMHTPVSPEYDRSGSGQYNTIHDTSVLYTDEIRNTVLSFETDEDLIEYLNHHRKEFSYNNAAALRFIQSLWKQVSALISQEYELRCAHSDQTSVPVSFTIEKMIDWILGLYGPDDASRYRSGTESSYRRNRSLKTILKGNPLLHPFAEDSFPDRNTVQSCLSGRHVSYESVRKLLILLLFYRFWIRKAIKYAPGSRRICYTAGHNDDDRCRQEINRYLSGAGYLELYYGNPYDWIFLYCMPDDEPLVTFRMFMIELVLEKQENR